MIVVGTAGFLNQPGGVVNIGTGGFTFGMPSAFNNLGTVNATAVGTNIASFSPR